jgi:hypothetical protein
MAFRRELVERELVRLRGSIALLAERWRRPRNWVFARMVGYGRGLTSPPYRSALLREIRNGLVVVDPLDRVWILVGYVKNEKRRKRKVSVGSLLFVREDQGGGCAETVKLALGPYFARVKAAKPAAKFPLEEAAK